MTKHKAPGLVINARLSEPMTGVQRVAVELMGRLGTPHLRLAPARHVSGLPGLYWDQAILPLRSGDKLLWSPCNIGPVAVSRQVLTIHDASVLDHPEWFSPTFVAVYRAIWSLLVPRLTKLVTDSEFSRARLAAHFGLPAREIVVVPCAAGHQFTPSGRDAISAARRHYGLGDLPYFATLGTLEPRKNLRLVLTAWQEAAPSFERTQLVVIGARGPSHVFAKNDHAQGDLPGITPIGYVDDEWLPALLSGAVALIYPSHYEGFGLPVLEAMACGTPVITSTAGALLEVAGGAAIHVDPNGAADLVAAMKRVLKSADLRCELSAKGLERASAFSWDRSAAAMDALFASCL